MRTIQLLLAVAMIGGQARAAGTGHEALFAAPVNQSRLVVHDMLWQCRDRQCITVNESDSRPVIMCMALARAIGPVLAFSTRGMPLAAQALARCNSPREATASVSSR
ncbi:MAG TPA: hypothetical protein VGE65_08855 [Sphingobium sp.]